MNLFLSFILALLILPSIALAQHSHQPLETACTLPAACVDEASKAGQPAAMTMESNTFIESITSHSSSGPSAEPDSTPVPMFMTPVGKWMLMVHANAFIVDEQQSSPRGGDKAFSTNCHHQEDSTHISDDVMMLGLTYRLAKDLALFRASAPMFGSDSR